MPPTIQFRRPTAEDLANAKGRTVPDLIAPDLRVLFCGINPGLYSAAVGHHFGRPGNRFWKALHASGFTTRLLSPFEDRTLLDLGLGITNLCPRTTRTAAELTRAEIARGRAALARKIARWRPAVVAFVGVSLYAMYFGRATGGGPGAKPDLISGAPVFVVPNPSGLNASYPGFAHKLVWFEKLRAFLP